MRTGVLIIGRRSASDKGVSETMRLDGKVALITGGGSGVGAASARRLAAEGAAVAVLGRTPGTLEAVAADVTRGGARALAVPCDVADAAQVGAAVERTLDVFGRLD